MSRTVALTTASTMAKISKRLQSDKRFSKPRLVAEVASERRIIAKGAIGCRGVLFMPIAASISRKRANGCRVKHISKITRCAHQDRDAIGQDAGKVAQYVARETDHTTLCKHENRNVL